MMQSPNNKGIGMAAIPKIAVTEKEMNVPISLPVALKELYFYSSLA